MTTLMHRKADLGHLEAQIEEHKATCVQCRQTRKYCDERREMQAEATSIRAEIRTWFDPPPGSPTLFDDWPMP